MKLFKAIESFLMRHMSSSSHQLVVVGTIAFLGFPLLDLIWTYAYPQPNEHLSLGLGLTASALGFGLMLSPVWPKRCKKYIHWYWFASLLYILPFFFTYSFLVNRASDVASLSLLCSVFLLVLIADFQILSLLLILGIGLGVLGYWLTVDEFFFHQDHMEVVILAIFFIVAGSTVSYRTAVVQRQRIKGMAAAAGMIAHELRTPLLGMKSGAQALNRVLPKLFEVYQKANEHQLVDAPVRQSRLLQLEGASERIIREIDYTNTMIDMLLIKAGRENYLRNSEMHVCSMKDCIHEAIERYPFRTYSANDVVSWSGDFKFIGSKLLMQQVLFNLIKNALYAIEKAQKGNIRIWTEQKNNQNYLYFEDTAKGMAPKQAAQLFQHFYTTTFMGTGIGLSFCKLVMERFGGDILCETEEGEYARFVMSFPIIEA